MLLADILEVFVPRGWFPLVTPGTRFVTVGGAIANDVHGKNHHAAGSLAPMRAFELLRPTARGGCTADENADWFAATIGGLADRPRHRGRVAATAHRRQRDGGATSVSSGSTRFAASAEAAAAHEYSVAWLIVLADAAGVLIAEDHGAPSVPAIDARRGRRVPLTPPVSLVNGLSLRAFNDTAYYAKPWPANQTVHYAPYFYPLDAIGDWNRIYGPRGFLPVSVGGAGPRQAARRRKRSAGDREGLGRVPSSPC